MSKLLKGFAVCALLLVGGQALADSHGDGGGEGPITHSAPAPQIPHPGK